MEEPVMLTTFDNPFNPFTEFEDWFAFDQSKGYNTCNFLARFANTSEELPENLNDFIIKQAIDEIVSSNLTGLYRKVGIDGKPVV